MSNLSDLSDNERVPYTVEQPRLDSTESQTVQQRKKKRKRSPYCLIVMLRYSARNRPRRFTVPVSIPYYVWLGTEERRCHEVFPACCIHSYECLNPESDVNFRPLVECRHLNPNDPIGLLLSIKASKSPAPTFSNPVPVPNVSSGKPVAK